MQHFLVVFVILLFSTPTTGQPLTFFGEDRGTGHNNPPLESWPTASAAFASFLTLQQDVAIVDFENLAANSTAPISLDFNGEEAVLSGRGVVREILADTYAGTYPTSGTHYWLVDNPTAPFTVEFTSPQTSFGFFATDVSDFYGTILMRLDDGREFPVPAYENWPSGSVLFFGIYDPLTPFSSISLIPDTIDHGWGPSHRAKLSPQSCYRNPGPPIPWIL